MTGQTAIIYVRVSTRDQADHGYSPAQQEKKCRKHCAEHGLTLIHEPFVESASGSKGGRKVFNDAITFCKRKRPSFIVFADYSRYSRESDGILPSIELYDRYGVDLRDCSAPQYSLRTGKGRKHFLQSSTNAAVFSYDLSDKMKESAYHKAKRGEWHCASRPPFGYDYDQQTKKLVPSAEQSHFVTLAYKLLLDRYSQSEILRQLTNKGALAKSGRKLTAQNIKEILTRRTYLGELVATHWETGEKETVESTHPALVESQTFDRAQAILAGNAEPQINLPADKDEPYPLKKTVLCSCGGKLTGCKSKGKSGRYFDYYLCRSCKKSIKVAKLHWDFATLLSKMELSAAYLPVFKAMMRETWQRVTEDTRKEESRLQSDLGTLEGKLEQVGKNIALAANPKLQEIMLSQYEQMEQEIAARTAELNAIQAESVDIEEVLALAEGICSNTMSYWLNGSSQSQLALQTTLFTDGISYNRETGDFEEVRTPQSLSLFNTLETLRASQNEGISCWRPQGDSNPCYRRERAVS